MGGLHHVHGHGVTLSDSHGRRCQQTLVQPLGGKLFLALLVPDHQVGDSHKLLAEGQQEYGSRHIEDAVDHGDLKGADGHIGKAEMDQRVQAVEQGQEEHRADEVEGHMDRRDLFRVAFDADAGDQGGDAGADILAHDDGNGHAVGNISRQSQGLQNAHRRGRALNDAGKQRADQNAQERITEGGEQAGKLRHIRQRADGTAHELHAVHQHGKAYQNRADVPASGLLGHHDKDGTHHGKDQGEILRLQELQPYVVRLQAHQGKQPGRQRRADVGAHNDAGGLGNVHKARVDQAHQHDGHRRGRLDRNGDARAQGKAFQRVGGHTLEGVLQLAAGHTFQPRGHDVHAVEEKGQTADEGDDGENIHITIPRLITVYRNYTRGMLRLKPHQC